MKLRYLVCFFGIIPSILLAAEPHFLVPAEQYAVLPTPHELEIAREYYGKLEGYPLMYELEATQPFTLSAQLAQVDSERLEPFSLLIVEVLPSESVREVARVYTEDAAWQEERDSTLGVTWRTGTHYEQELPAGTYWIEVSTPSNMGSYQLRLGTQVQSIKYFDQWSRVVAVNSFLDRSFLGLLRSRFVLTHVVVLAFIGLGVYLLRRYRRRRSFNEAVL